MAGRGKTRRLTLGWRKVFLGIGCAGLAVVGACLARGSLGPASMQVAAADQAGSPAPQPAPATPSSYSSTFVATLGENKQGITREELGEYLIARHGEKVEHLINRRIIEDACKAAHLEVTAADVEQKLKEDLKDLNIDQARFVREFLKARQKTLYEWKEDNLRPQLMMMKL